MVMKGTCLTWCRLLSDAASPKGGSRWQTSTSRRQRLKDDFITARGYWSELWDGVLQLSPEFFEAYSAFSSVPWKHGTLPPKIKELIYVAIDASTTHLYNPGTRIHIANALKQGATRDEVMEVLQIVSVLGIHTMSTGLPILIDELRKSGRGGEVKEGPLTAAQERLKQDFIANRGYWNPVWSSFCSTRRNSSTPIRGCRRCRGSTACWRRRSAS